MSFKMLTLMEVIVKVNVNNGWLAMEFVIKIAIIKKIILTMEIVNVLKLIKEMENVMKLVII